MSRSSILAAIVAVGLLGVSVGAASAVGLGSSTAGTSGAAVATPSGKALFLRMGCGSCHTMKAARATGTIGPSLDRAKPTRARVIARVTNGKGAMPSFRRQLTRAQIAALATYVANNT